MPRGFFFGASAVSDPISLSAVRSGRLGAAAALLRDVPTGVIPYAANGALNIIGKRAREDLRAEMPRVFDRPNAWTLNSIRVLESTRETLTVRLFVKDDAPNNGTRPEEYLLPEVFGGGRNEKRFEAALRYAGILPPGWRAMPGEGAKLDQYGNMARGEIQRILTAVKANRDSAQNRTGSARSRRNAKNAPYFVGGLDVVSVVGGRAVTRKSSIPPGIYARKPDGRGITPVLIFVRKPPQYRSRLDFGRVVEERANADFETEFVRLADAITSRRQ